MLKLEKLINYEFKDLNKLADAMNSTSLGNDVHYNDALATVGDAVLKSLIADYLYQNVTKSKSDITDKKKDLEKNETLHNVVMKTGIINYAYNDKHFYNDKNIPDNEKVVSKGHDSYLEAIVGAIYYDGGYNSLKKWFLGFLYECLCIYKVEK